ncbi:polyprenyl synthetase family protein [Streptomyces sp. NPDC004539]|uniref:polyprenyl synthetase family protein n=1 Tax=Streptomyces sp. NPDC004539 TaxID=3154280 RepID=UPI0033B8FEA2
MKSDTYLPAPPPPRVQNECPNLDLTAVRHRVDRRLEEFLDAKAEAAHARHLPPEVTSLLRDFVLNGGKRVRPLLCAVGWCAAGGDPQPPEYVIQAAASLEMFHAFALIHDDVMDGALLRRGTPTVHRALAATYSHLRDPDRFGEHSAILLGDLAHAWSDELLHSAGIPDGRAAAVRTVTNAMRSEVMFGQYLDLLATGPPQDDADAALRIVRYKTARYTVERPLHLGAALAGAEPDLLTSLSAYALPIGEAFQLRDDVLGTFGDPRETGKPCLDDLRDGKGTLLVALAMQHADEEQRRTLRALIGSPGLGEEDAERIRHLLCVTGARAAVEQLIGVRREQAQQALDQANLTPAATAALQEIALTSTVRTS